MKNMYELIKNFQFYSSRYLKIKTKESEIIPFSFNKTQQLIEQIRKWVKENGYLERYIILKARQKGASTYWEGDIFHAVSTSFNCKAAVIGHKLDASQNLFDMILRFYKYLPEQIKPQTKNTNEKKIKYSKLDSEIKVITAGLNGDDVGRSDTINKLHATEVAFWNDAENTLLGLLQCVPDNEDSLIVLESTANGMGGAYHNRWQIIYTDSNKEEIIKDVAWKSKDSRYVAIFISWVIDNEYTLQFDTEKEKDNFLKTIDNEEIMLLKRGASPEHLKWRRFTIIDKCNGDVERFKQEYPSTPEEAFLVSGRPVFDTKICNANILKCEEPESIGNLELKDEEVNFIKNKFGYIKLFYYPIFEEKDRNRFVAGVDVAEGLEQGDYSDISILDRKTMRTILNWHGHIDPDLLAEEMYKIYLFLNKDCYFNVEMNNHGLTTIVSALKLKVKQYFREDFSKGWNEDKTALGTKTTAQTKPLMINDLNEYIREELFFDDDKEFWGECLTFVKNSKGQMQAQDKDKDPATKCFDDRVMSHALMIRCHKWLPGFQYPKKEEVLARPHIKEMYGKARGKTKF